MKRSNRWQTSPVARSAGRAHLRFRFGHRVAWRFGVAVSLCVLLGGLSACGSQADDAYMPTETGNPPVIDDSAIELSFDDDSVIVAGAAGAVDPGAEVRVENERTGRSGETSADASGAFVVELEGDLGDPLSIHVTTSGGTSSVELVAQSLGGDAGAASSASSNGESSNVESTSSGDVTMVGAGSAIEAAPDCAAGGSSVLSLTGANNYTYASELNYELAIVNSGIELSFDWSELTRDPVGRPIDANRDVAMLTLFLVNLSAPEAMGRLHDGDLSSNDLVAALTHAPTDELSAKLTEFSVLGGEIRDDDVAPYFEAGRFPKDEYTYVLAASSGTTLGLDVLTYQPFQLSDEAVSDRVWLNDESLSVNYTVDLTSSEPLRVPLEVNDVRLQLALETDAHGRTFASSRFDRMTIARYDRMSRSELQSAFFEMEQLADGLWSADASSLPDVRLADFLDAGGNPLPQLGSADTWVLTAHCTNCPDRSPAVMSFLEACEP